MKPEPWLGACVFWNGLVEENGCWHRAARPAVVLGTEGEEGLQQGRRNCKIHFRKEMRDEEKQTPCLGSQVIKHWGS